MPFSAQSWYAFAVPVQEFAPGIPSKSTLHALPSFKQPRVFEFGVHHHLSEGPAKEHFDLRLGDPETGHAHSWALKYLPKPGERRLAVQQPTHTVGYMDFKGRIEGGYGKGQVNLLRRDRAEVLRSSPDSVRFNIYGGKDVEEYSLSRMKDRNWLIQNVTTTRASGLLPSSKPSYKEVPEHHLGIEDPKTELQAKIDGAHVLYQFKDPGSLPRVLSYRPTERLTGVIEHTHKLPDFHALRTPGALKDTILRGELYATDHAGKALPAARVGGILNAGVWKSREKQSAEGTLKPVVFDVVRWRGADVESAPYAKKREMLQQAIKAAPWLSLPRRASTPAEKRKLLEDIKTGREPSTEEGVVEWHEDKSVPGKTKFLAEQDVHVRGVFKEKGTRNLAGGFEFSRSPDGPIVGRVGTGMSHEMKKDMLAQPDKYVGLKARIQAQRAPAHYAPRAPSFLSFHLDQELPEGIKTAKTRSMKEVLKVLSPEELGRLRAGDPSEATRRLISELGADRRLSRELRVRPDPTPAWLATFSDDARRAWSGRHAAKPGEVTVPAGATPLQTFGEGSEHVLFRGNALPASTAGPVWMSRHPDVASGYAVHGFKTPGSGMVFAYERGALPGPLVESTPDAGRSASLISRAKAYLSDRKRLRRARQEPFGKHPDVEAYLKHLGEYDPTYEVTVHKNPVGIQPLGSYRVRGARTAEGNPAYALTDVSGVPAARLLEKSSSWGEKHAQDYQAFLEMVKNARVKEAKTRSVKQWQAAETSDPALAKSIEQFYGREGTATEAPFSRRLEAYKQWKAQGGVGQRPVPTGPQGLGLSERQLKDISIGGAETGVDLTMGRLHPSQLSEVVPRHAQEMQSQARVRKLWKPDATAVAAEEVPAHLSQKMHTTERILGMPGNEDAAAKMYAHGKTPYGNVSYHEYVRGAQALPHPDDLRAAGASPAAVQAAEDARFNLASQVQKQVADPLRAQGIHLADVPSVHLGAPTRAGVLPYEATGNFANVPLVKGKPKILDFMVHQEGTRNPGVLFPLEETGQYGSITSSPSRVGSSFMETGAKGSERRALNDLRKAHFRGVMPEIESAATRAQHMAGMRSAATKLWEHAPSWVPRRTAPITPGAAPMMEQLGDVATRVFKKVAGAQDDQATGHPYLGAALGTGLGLTGLVAASPTLRANAKSILRSIRQGKLIGARGAEAAAELPPEVMLQAEQMAKHLRAAGFDPKKHSIAVGATGATGKSTTARALAKALGVTHRELDDAYSHGGLGLSGLNLQRYLEKNPIAPGTVAEQNLLLNQADPEKFFAMVHLEKPIEKIREQALKRGRSAFQLDVMDYPHMQKSIRTAFEQAQGPMHEIAPGLRMKIRGPEGFKAQETLESKARELGFDPTGLSREQLVRSVALGSRSTGAGDLAYIHKPRVALGTGVLAAGGLGGAELGSQLAGDDSTKLGYKLQGHDNFQGLPIAIENKKGDVRKGVDRDGHKWRTVMKYPYGYIEGTKAKDGEGVDAYVGPKRDAAHAYVVHQHKPDGTGFDEDKVMLGFDSEEAARKAYLKQYDDPKFLGPISRVPMEELRELVKSHKKLEKISMSKAVAR